MPSVQGPNFQDALFDVLLQSVFATFILSYPRGRTNNTKQVFNIVLSNLGSREISSGKDGPLRDTLLTFI